MVNVPSMVSTTEGDTSITISCTATGVPVPTINWTIPDSGLVESRHIIGDPSPPVVVTDDSNEVFQVTGSLTIMNVVRGDAGVYSCVVSNVLNNIQSDTTLTVMCK